MKKIALICAMVMVIGAIPVFAITNDTTNTTTNSNEDKSTVTNNTNTDTSSSNTVSTTNNKISQLKQHQYRYKNKTTGTAKNHRYGQDSNRGVNCSNADCACDQDQTRKNGRLRDGSCQS